MAVNDAIHRTETTIGEGTWLQQVRSTPLSTIHVKGIIRNGRVEVEEPINLPDGSEVTITGSPNSKFVGLPDNGDSMTPDEIAATLEAMDKIEPFDMTDEERAAWGAERQARKEWEKAHFAEHAERLGRMWGGNWVDHGRGKYARR